MTLDSDVADRLKELVKREDKPFKQVVNEILRRGMAGTDDEARPAFRVSPHRGGFIPGVDLLKLNQLVDELDTEDFVAESSAK